MLPSRPVESPVPNMQMGPIEMMRFVLEMNERQRKEDREEREKERELEREERNKEREERNKEREERKIEREERRMEREMERRERIAEREHYLEMARIQNPSLAYQSFLPLGFPQTPIPQLPMPFAGAQGMIMQPEPEKQEEEAAYQNLPVHHHPSHVSQTATVLATRDSEIGVQEQKRPMARRTGPVAKIEKMTPKASTSGRPRNSKRNQCKVSITSPGSLDSLTLDRTGTALYKENKRGANRKSYQCVECGDKFDEEKSVLKHQIKVHRNNESVHLMKEKYPEQMSYSKSRK